MDAPVDLKTPAKSDAKDAEIPIDIARYQVAPDGKWIAIIADEEAKAALQTVYQARVLQKGLSVSSW